MSSHTEYLNRLGRTAESDECYTPMLSVEPLLQFLDKDKTYYEATSGKSSSLVEGLRHFGYKVESSGDKDFFTTTKDDVFDGVITNPPYSKKDKFITHCYNLNKPFALLLPVAAFQGLTRGKLFIDKGVSALVYNKRLDFTGGKSPSFGNAWFMWGLSGGQNKLYFTNYGVT